MSDEQIKAIARKAGVSEAEVTRLLKQLTYRKLYNKRPEVVARRKEYNKARQATLKEAMRLYREKQAEERKAFKDQLEREREQSATESGATGIHGNPTGA